jgi:hypothetical protein
MAQTNSSSKEDAVSTSSEPTPRRRKHGYRGYPNNPRRSDIHWGSGFAGIGSMSELVGSSGILSERTRHHAARPNEDDADALGS